VNSIKSVTSPLKGGVDYNIGEKTLLVGPNGSGKTSVLQAIKLATQGFVDDQDGSDDVKQTAAIARLFPPGVDLSSVVVFSNGAKSCWSSVRKGGKKPSFTRPVMGTVEGPGGEAAPAVVFPFQEFKGLLSSSAQAVRSWMEARVVGKWTHDMLIDLLPPNLHDRGRALLRYQEPSSPLALALHFKRMARSTRMGATKREKVAAQLVEGAQLPLTARDVEEYQLAVSSLEAEITKHMQSGAVDPKTHEVLKLAGAKLEKEVEKQREALQVMKSNASEADPIAQAAPTLVRLIKEHTAVITYLGASPMEDCYLCLRSGGNIMRAMEKWSALVPKGDEPTAEQVKHAVAKLATTLEQLQRAKVRASMPVVDLTSQRDELRRLSELLGANKAVEQVWSNAEAVTRQVAFDRSHADEMTSVADVWEKQGNLLLLRSMVEYEAGVSAFLPEGESFKFDQTSGRFLLCGDGLERSSLSGAEMVRLLLALMAFEHGSSGDSTLYVLDAEDRGWDPDTLSSVMKAIAPVPAQVILMSTVRPASIAPESWTIIPTGE
jgi:energy-coupling factor transporter ATP-binding protein EcfA2